MNKDSIFALDTLNEDIGNSIRSSYFLSPFYRLCQINWPEKRSKWVNPSTSSETDHNSKAMPNASSVDNFNLVR